MQATLAPPPVWWDLERWHRRRARGRGGERGGERNGERSGMRLADHASLGQLRLRELQRMRDIHALLDRQRLSVPDIFLYSPSRFGGPAAGEGDAQPTSTWRQRPLWHHRDILQPTGRNSESRAGEPAGAGTGGEAWGAARGWAVGALLLLAALLLLRATDRCLAGSYCRPRRRRSEEWPTPSVLATTQRTTEIDMAVTVDAFPSESSESGDVFGAELPPPYSECAPERHKRAAPDEPPPPYSACHVAYCKAGPGVRLYSAAHEPLGDAARPQIAHSSNGYLTGEAAGSPARAPLAAGDGDSDDGGAAC